MNPSKPVSGRASLKFLVVDDDAIMRELLKSILRREGLMVVGDAADGEAALLKCETLEPHIVYLDINMPKLDGIHVLEKIRETHPQIKVIMVSGEATPEFVREAISKGACGFVVKPYNAAKILQSLERCAGHAAG